MLGFTGCVQYFNVTGYILPISGHSEKVDIWLSSTLIQSSCSSSDYCLPSSCTEDNIARRNCLSAHCQNQWKCGPVVQNGSCICLHNISHNVCDMCISTTESYDRCTDMQGSPPLWLIAVFLPVFSILVIIVMLVALYRMRQHNLKCLADSSPQKTEQGADNVTFCFDESRRITDTAKQENQHDLLSSDEQRSSMKHYCDASLSSVQPGPTSELEYYEIGSICSALHPDSASLQLSWHKHLYSTKCVKTDPKQWRDLRMLLAGFSQRHSSEDSTRSPINPENVASLNKQLLPKMDTVHAQKRHPYYTKKFLPPEPLEPMQYLTFEEISKLNTPLESIVPHQASLKFVPARSTIMINVSSDSETDSTFTCSESEYGQFSIMSTRKYIDKQSTLSAYNIRQQSILPVNSLFKHTYQSATDHFEAESTPYATFEQWENIFNMNLPFSMYAPIFEDIACLPVEPTCSYEVQSDIEEII